MASWNVNPSAGVTGSGPSFTFPANTDASDKTYIVTYNGDYGESCTHEVTVQGTIDCCSSYNINIVNMLPNTGVSSSYSSRKYIGTITSDNSKCPISNVTLTSSTLSLTIEDSYIYVTSCTAAGDDVVVHTISIVGCPGVSTTVIQEGSKVKCTCDSLKSSFLVIQSAFTNDAHSDVMFASGDTHGCGTMSADTDTGFLHIGVDHWGANDRYYKITGSVDSNTDSSTPQRTGTIMVYFKKAGETAYTECTAATFTCKQNNSEPAAPRSCDFLDNGTKGSGATRRISLPATSSSTYYNLYSSYNNSSWPPSSHPSSAYSCIVETIYDNGIISSLLTTHSSGSNTFIVYLRWIKNTEHSERTAQVKITPYYVDIYGERHYCEPITYNITQSASTEDECSCQNYDFSILDPTENPIVLTSDAYQEIDVYLGVKCPESGPLRSLPEGWSIQAAPPESTPAGHISDVTSPTFVSYGDPRYKSTIIIPENRDKESWSGVCRWCLHCTTGEVKCFEVSTGRDPESNACQDCDSAKNVFYTASNIRSAANENVQICGKYSPSSTYCYVSIGIAEYCDSNGNPASYDWLGEIYNSRGAVYTRSVARNRTSSTRTAYVKVVPSDVKGEELFSNCYKIVPIRQTGSSACTCSNLADYFSYTTTAINNLTSSSNRVGPGTNIHVGTVTVSTKNVFLDNLYSNFTTESDGYITDVRVDDSGQVISEDGITRTYEVYCDISTDTMVDYDTYNQTIDVRFKIGSSGDICDISYLTRYFTVYIKKRN